MESRSSMTQVLVTGKCRQMIISMRRVSNSLYCVRSQRPWTIMSGIYQIDSFASNSTYPVWINVALFFINERTIVDFMVTFSSIYEKQPANNKVYMMKKLCTMKILESMSIAQHLNDFNTISNQLSFVEIEFGDQIRVLFMDNTKLNYPT